MKQLFYFVMVGLAFTVLQVVTVEAQEVDLDMGASDVPPPGIECDLGGGIAPPVDCPEGTDCEPDMESPMGDLGMAFEEDETGIPRLDPATMTPHHEEDHRRLPAPEDMGKFFEYDQEYRTNGVLSQASYDKLSEDGYTKKRVDWVLMTDHGNSQAE